MGLDVPDLDDRTYEELLESARQLIPAYSEEWTDHNPQDPGIATLEVLAWLTETYIYQLDQVTDEHRKKYLGLLGTRPRPPQAATTELTVEVPPEGAGEKIPAGERLTAVDGSETDKTFETTAPVILTGASVAAVVTATDDGTTDHTDANGTGGTFYRPFGATPAAGDAMYVGFDTDPFHNADRLSLHVDFHEDNLPSVSRPGQDEESDGPALTPSVELSWEYCTDYQNWTDDEAWAALEVVTDETNELYWGGRVTVERPAEWTPGAWALEEAAVAGHDPGLYWIRCRVERGGYEVPPQVTDLAVNVVPVAHRTTVTDEPLERVPPGDPPAGLDGQAYRFGNAPVLSATVTVDGNRWTAVQDFDASGPTDRHYVLDRVDGVIRFGDGRTGRIPPPDADVVAHRYVHGGGDAGNVPAGASWRFTNETATVGTTPLPAVPVTPREAADGGADAESIAAAFRRVRRDMATPTRAVTREDLTTLATNTPGCRFGRATVRRGTASHVSGVGREGGREPTPRESRVIVVPYAPADVARPEPSEGFLDAVADHLDRHRLLTDRLRVRPPTYATVDLEVDLVTDRRLPVVAMEDRISAAVGAYVDPLRGYDGDGWPFGRTLYTAEVGEVVAGLDWVEAVDAVSIHVGGDGRLDGEGNVLIAPASLLAVGTVTVTADVQTGTSTGKIGATGSTAAPDGAGGTDPGWADTDTPTAVSEGNRGHETDGDTS